MPSALDQRLFLCLNADHGLPWVDKLMAVFSSLDLWLPFMVLAVLLTLYRGGFRARAMVVCLLLSIALLEGVFVGPLKRAFGRPRPSETVAEARVVSLAPATPTILALGQPARIKEAKVSPQAKPGKSFPSGHTANMFCLATVLAAFYWPRGAWFYIAAGLVGVSRIATGSHWPSDVLFTAVLTIPLTLLMLRFYGLLWRMLAPRLAPDLALRHPDLLASRR